MRTDAILEVGLHPNGVLYITPATARFPHAYREAMEVDWDASRHRLFGGRAHMAKPRFWFRQILCLAREQGVQLELTAATRWREIDDALKAEMLAPDA